MIDSRLERITYYKNLPINDRFVVNINSASSLVDRLEILNCPDVLPAETLTSLEAESLSITKYQLVMSGANVKFFHDDGEGTSIPF